MSLLIGRRAPDFEAPAVLANGVIVARHRLHVAIEGRYAMLFFNPLAFLIACTSELLALDRYREAFRRRDVALLGVAIDPGSMRTVWHDIPVEGSGLGAVGYPLVTDMDHTICERYGLKTPYGRIHARAAFLIDPHGIVRYQAINDLPLDQEIDDLLRMIDALQAPTTEHRARRRPKPRVECGELANRINQQI